MLNAEAQLEQRWLEAAEAALATNASTFAVLGIDQLLPPNGLLSQLQARDDYAVREP